MNAPKTQETQEEVEMSLFGKGGQKKGNGVTVEDYGGDQVGMMKMLAGMPHMMRKPMMKGRLTQLLTLTEEKRQESIRDMIGAFHSPKVKSGTRDKLIATRVEIIGELPEDKRRTIISSRAAALKVAPKLDEADRVIQERVLPKISASAREAFTSTWKQVSSASNG